MGSASQISTSTSWEADAPKARANLLASVLGYMSDGIDQLIISFTMVAIIAAFSLTTGQGGEIATATMLGTWGGSYLFGFLADYFGRVRTFTYSILLYALATGISAYSPDFHFLLAMRFLTGMGIGGEFGIGMTVVTETWNPAKRARAGSYVAIGFQIGIVLASLITTIFLPLYGWRSVFLVGMAPALLAFWARRNLKEPTVYLERRKLPQSGFPLAHLFENSKTSKTTIGLTIMTTVQNMGFYGIMIWMPAMLSKVHHYTLTKTTLWTVLTTIGMISGTLVFGFVADKLGRRRVYIAFFLVSALLIPLYFNIASPTLLLFGGLVLGFFVNGMMGGYGALLSEHYTTTARATAVNFIFGTGRGLGGGLGPLFIGMLAIHMGLSVAMSLLFIVYPVAALACYLFVPETKGLVLPA